MSNLDQERRLKEFSNQELLSAIKGQTSKVSEVLATRALLGRTKGRSLATAVEILEHQKKPDLRIAAFRSLGQAIDPRAQKVLIDNLGARDQAELRSVVWSLAKIGDAEALKKLGQVNLRGREDLSDSVEGAKRLLAFRNGITGMEFDGRKLAKVGKIPSQSAQKMEVRQISKASLEQHRAHILTEVPGVDLTKNAVVGLTCLRKQLWLVNASKVEDDLKNLLEKPNIPMAIFGYAHCSDRPYLHAYVYAQPSRTGAKLFVTRLRGQTTHAGELKLKGNEIEFELNALQTRFSPPATIAGSMKRGGKLEVSKAEVSNDTEAMAKLRRQPKLVDLPIGLTPDQIGQGDRPD